MTIDRTIACRVITSLDSGAFGLSAQVQEPPRYAGGGKVLQPGEVGVSPANSQGLYAAASKILFANGKNISTGYYFDSSACEKANTVPLTQGTLPLSGVFSQAGQTSLTDSCPVPANTVVTVRLKVVMAKPGTPTSAELAIRAGKAQHPYAFITWKPTRFTAYVSAACVER